MNRQAVIASVIGLSMFASPLFVAAQTVTASSDTSTTALLALLTQLIQTLEQEIAQLTAAAGTSSSGTVPASPATTQNTTGTQVITFTPVLTTTTQVTSSASATTVPARGTQTNATTTPYVRPNSQFYGSANYGPPPLSVVFTGYANGVNTYDLDFGDGSTPYTSTNHLECFANDVNANPNATPGAACPSNPTGQSSPFQTQHTYTAGGTYVATLTSGDSGGLIGTYTVTVVGYAPGSCVFSYTEIPNGSSVTAYAAASVPAGQTCQAVTRTCNDGTLSGSAPYAICVVGGQ